MTSYIPWLAKVVFILKFSISCKQVERRSTLIPLRFPSELAVIETRDTKKPKENIDIGKMATIRASRNTIIVWWKK